MKTSVAHPGQILLKQFMEPHKISINKLGRVLHVPPNRVLEIVNGHRGITPDTARRLSRYFVNRSTHFWLDLQRNYDLQDAENQALVLEREIVPCISGFDYQCLHCGQNTNGQQIIVMPRNSPADHVHKRCYGAYLEAINTDPKMVSVPAVIPETMVETLVEVATEHYDEFIGNLSQDPEAVRILQEEKQAVIEALRLLQRKDSRE
jgi:addiction module HigA family antidote